MTQNQIMHTLSRRRLLSTGFAGVCAAVTRAATPKNTTSQKNATSKTSAAHFSGIRICPGAWRPHYPWEHIAWISPPWPGQDYIWFDFPEAIFTKQGLLFLSQTSPQYPVLFPNLPAIKWQSIPSGITYERTLPNGVAFGGKITKTGNEVNLELFIRNGSETILEDIKLQTCLFLRACKEFAAYTADNKYVHIANRGWLPFNQARSSKKETGKYHLGWRSGPAIADRPIMVTLSSEAQRLVAFTWFADTYSLVNNPKHPCMHADPAFTDLPPGTSVTIRGKILFFEGTLDDFDKTLQKNQL